MEKIEFEQRLSRIATRWTVVREAHASSTELGEPIRGELLLQYRGAVYRYLLGGTRNPDVAEDLCQDFALRFLRGDFRRADREKGRFRDYVKTALVNMINDYHRERNRTPQLPDSSTPIFERSGIVRDLPPDESFLQDWRADLLDQTWTALRQANPAYHTVLLLRIENPDMESPELAQQASVQLGKSITPEYARKTLQRAHAKFAELMLDQVAASLDEPTDSDIETELMSLDLLKYCRSTLEARKKKHSGVTPGV